jgi:hypothetical protein
MAGMYSSSMLFKMEIRTRTTCPCFMSRNWLQRGCDAIDANFASHFSSTSRSTSKTNHSYSRVVGNNFPENLTLPHSPTPT